LSLCARQKKRLSCRKTPFFIYVYLMLLLHLLSRAELSASPTDSADVEAGMCVYPVYVGVVFAVVAQLLLVVGLVWLYHTHR
jgi:hypothetical protein